MIAVLIAALLAQTQSLPSSTPDAVTRLDAIGQQSLPARGCAAYLWSVSDRRLVAMAVADPGMLRLSIDGRTIDLMRSAQEGSVALGFGTTTGYAAGDVSATLDMTVVPRENLTAGAQVPTGSLRVDRAGRDTLVVPVAGLVGCVA